ncbi:hypothetical protein BC833DRAFT_583265 [Globomyces pollinis-pini]|nr:hypothetical protein BC833DRAFT_583265 [Globomyces pollinis-pini]
MYSQNAIHSTTNEANLVYISKLRENLQEMSKMKQDALDSKNYNTSEQLRIKIGVLQIQLMKMEDQFTSDILQNFITSWQSSLISEINSSLYSPVKLKSLNILTLPFHVAFMNIVKGIPLTYYDSLIRAMLILLPHELPDSFKSPYGWEFIAKKIHIVNAKSQDTIDIIKSTVAIAVMDVICISIGGSTSEFVKKETYDLTLRHIFHYIQLSSARKMNLDLEGELFDSIFTRCSVTVSYIGQNSRRRDIFRYILSFFESAKKSTNEMLVMMLTSLKYLFVFPESDSMVQDTVDYIKDLSHLVEKVKKPVVKVALIQTLERVVQPLQVSGERSHHETTLWTEISNLYKKAKKWLAVEELRPSTLQLMTIIMVNSRIDFFVEHIDSYLNSDMWPKMKLKPYTYTCILQLLRGRYYQDTIENFEDVINGTYVPGRHFSYLTRLPNEQSFGSVSNRLNLISDIVLLRRKESIPEEYLDTCAAIVVQIAAHSIVLGAKLISQLIDTTRVDNNAESYYLGLRALRTILDNDSGFSKYSASKSDPQFGIVLKDFPYELTPSISSIYTFMESQIGCSVVGTNGKVLDLISMAREVNPAKHEVQPSTGMMAMLHSSLNQLSLSSQLLTSPSSNASQSQNLLEDGEDTITALKSTRAALESNGAGRRRSSLLVDIHKKSSSTSSISSEFESNSIESDESITKALIEWFKLMGYEGKDVSKFVLTSSLEDKVRMKKKQAIKMKPEQKHALLLFHELMIIVRLVPTPEFIGGNLFIGTFLNHSKDDIAIRAANTICAIFKNHPDLRIGMINGFINYFKCTPYSDDISVFNLISVLSGLIKLWVDKVDYEKDFHVHKEGFYRVSCKLDASMLVIMAHPNQRIRTTCLSIIYDFYCLEKKFLEPTGQGIGKMSLAAILLDSEEIIVKQSIHAFFEADTFGYKLNAKSASAIKSPTFVDVCKSQYTILFKYYLGELTKRFAIYGRFKATRHCAKYLRKFAVPLIEKQTPNASLEHQAHYASQMVLLMALAGVPITSEMPYEQRPYVFSESGKLLFGCFRPSLPYLLTLDKCWEIGVICKSFYFLHRGVIHIFLSELMHNFAEVQHNSSMLISSKFIDNAFAMLRYIIQYPHFELLFEDTVENSATIIQIYSDLMSATSITLGDMGFLINGPSIRIKTAINHCIITYRLCECLNAVRRRLRRQARFDGNLIPLQNFEPILWKIDHQQKIVMQLKDWFEVMQDTVALANQPNRVNLPSVSGIQLSGDIRKVAKLRAKLLTKINLAMEQIMSFGGVFIELPLPSGLIQWMTIMEADGYHVFTTDFLYNFEDALGTVLANGYSGLGNNDPFIFTNAIFEQILPKLDDGPHTYLFGNSRRMSFAEPYLAGLHVLPLATPSELNSPSFIYPDIGREDAISLRQHLGSLLFFGLYNLMSSSIKVRVKSLVFIRELLQMFNPDEQFDVLKHLKSLNGVFYSSIGQQLKPKIIELCVICSTLFASDAGAYLWEAVRCARSVKRASQKTVLLEPQTWVIELMAPWFQFVNLDSITTDVVNTEFFRFMMESSFESGVIKDEVINCWIEVARSPEFGVANCSVLIDAIVEVNAKFATFQMTSMILASSLATVQSDLVSAVLAFHLSSSAFPWKTEQQGHPYSHSSLPAIKEYVATLHTLAKRTAPESSNDYKANCASAAYLTSNLLTHHFESFISHVPVLLNFIIMNLDGPLKAGIVSPLLNGLIYGFIAFLHSSELVDDPQFTIVQNNLRKVLGWLQMSNAVVTWTQEDELPKSGLPLPEIPIDKFFSELLPIFEFNNMNLQEELIDELLKWAVEGYLSNEESAHAINGYNVLLKMNKKLASRFFELLLPRLLDQLSILSQLEVEVKSLKTTDKPGYEGLPKGKLDLRTNAEDMILTILKVHSILLLRLKDNFMLENNAILFWSFVGLLNLPYKDFGNVVLFAIDNLLFMIRNIDTSKFEFESFEAVGQSLDKGLDVPQLLIPVLFDSSMICQDKAIEFLIQFHLQFDRHSVGSNPSSEFYFLLYFITWLFVRLEEQSLLTPTFFSIIRLMTDFLKKYYETAFVGILKGVNVIIDIFQSSRYIPPEARADIFDRIMPDFIKFFLNKYTNNMAQYIGQLILISPNHKQFGLKMAQLLWVIAMAEHQNLSDIGHLRSLIRSIPFLQDPTIDSDDLVLRTFDHHNQTFIKELDVASQGRVEPLPELDIPEGSVRAAWNWLHHRLKINPSNKMFDLPNQ